MLSNGIGIPSAVGSLVDHNINCRTVGRCTYDAHIDSELGDMV